MKTNLTTLPTTHIGANDEVIQSVHPHLPIIVNTAHGDSAIVEDCLEKGTDKAFSKTHSPQTMQATLTQLPLYPFLGRLVATYPSPMTVKEARTGRYVLANAAAGQRYGLTPETYCGLTFTEIGQQQNLLADHIAQEIQQDTQVCETQQPLQAKRMLLTSEQYLCIEQVTKQPILDLTEKVVAILTYSQDLTPRWEVADLFKCYQQYLPTKPAIRQCLQHLQIEDYFYKPPTKRELEVLLTMEKVNTAEQIAQYIDLHPRTVEEYKARLRSKLKIDLCEVVVQLRVLFKITGEDYL